VYLKSFKITEHGSAEKHSVKLLNSTLDEMVALFQRTKKR
jgi:hypothetical protein